MQRTICHISSRSIVRMRTPICFCYQARSLHRASPRRAILFAIKIRVAKTSGFLWQRLVATPTLLIVWQERCSTITAGIAFSSLALARAPAHLSQSAPPRSVWRSMANLDRWMSKSPSATTSSVNRPGWIFSNPSRQCVRKRKPLLIVRLCACLAAVQERFQPSLPLKLQLSWLKESTRRSQARLSPCGSVKCNAQSTSQTRMALVYGNLGL